MFDKEAEKMVAYLQDSVVDDDRLTVKTSEKPKPVGLPLTNEAALKWFYKDPQGEIQGERFEEVLCAQNGTYIVYISFHNSCNTTP